MRKNLIGIFVGLPLAWSFSACSSDSDPGNPSPGSGGAAGSSTTGMPASGGNAGVSSGGAGGVSSGGTAGVGSGGAGETVDAGKETGPVVDASPGPNGALAVYTMSDAAAGNQVLGFTRASDGTVTPMAAPFPTGGKGSGM